MREAAYQAKLIMKLKNLFPGCFVLKNDSDYLQGIPDLLVLFEGKWAMLEVKAKRPTNEMDFEPNQEWYLAEFSKMSFAACVYPENEAEVLDALQQAFDPRRLTRVSSRQQARVGELRGRSARPSLSRR